MLNEDTLREELEKERCSRQELQVMLQGHESRERILQEIIDDLKQQIKGTEPTGIKDVEKSQEEQKGNSKEAITDLHFNQTSPGGSANSRPQTNSSSNSFVVLYKNTHQQCTDLETSGSSKNGSQADHESKISEALKRVPVQSCAQDGSRLIVKPDSFQRSEEPFSKENLDDLSMPDSSRSATTIVDTHLDNKPIQNSDAWEHTGARPKSSNYPTQSKVTPKSHSEGQDVTNGAKEQHSQNPKMMVLIPSSEGTYRINHLPPLSHGKDVSMTGISSIFNSDEKSPPPTSMAYTDCQNDLIHFNDLNFEKSSSVDKMPVKDISPCMTIESFEKPVIGDPETKEAKRQYIISLPSLSLDSQRSESNLVKHGHPQTSSVCDTDLAVQLQNLALELKSKIISADSVNRIFQYAQVVARMEVQLKEYQTQSKQLENKAMHDKVMEMTELINQLFSANKLWEDNWKLLECQHKIDIDDLSNKLRNELKNTQQLKEKVDAAKELEEELKEMKLKNHELSQKAIVDASHKAIEGKMNRRVKKELDNINKANKELENRNQHLLRKLNELETESEVLKQQMTVIVSDYDKEKSEKTVLEEEVRKLKAEKIEVRRSLESKLKSANTKLTKTAEDLRENKRMLKDLQKVIESQSQEAEGQVAENEGSTIQLGSLTDRFCPSASPAYNPKQLKLYQQQKEITENSAVHQAACSSAIPIVAEESRLISTEYSENAWICSKCTFRNPSSKDFCEMCNCARIQDGSWHSYSIDPYSGMSQWPGNTVPDSST